MRKDIYSSDYLTRPFEMDGDSLPQVRTKAEGATKTAGVYSALRGLPDAIAQDNTSSDFFSQSATLQKNKRFEDTYKKVENGVGAVPVIGTAVSLFSKLGRAIGSTTTNQYGQYKSKGAEVLDNNVNPLTGVRNVFGIVKDIGDGGKFDWENLGNFATGGLFGKSSTQRELDKQRKFFDMKKSIDASRQNQQLGALNKVSDFKALPYGRNGLKIRTKLSKY